MQDEALSALPTPMQAQARAAALDIGKETDVAKLRAGFEQMTGQVSQVPPQMKPLFDYILSKIEERLAQLDAAGATTTPASKN